MNDSTDLRNRILQMREANNLNLVSEKSEYVDTKVVPKEDTTPEDNVINHKENFKSNVTNEILTQETDVKNMSLLNNKKYVAGTIHQIDEGIDTGDIVLQLKKSMSKQKQTVENYTVETEKVYNKLLLEFLKIAFRKEYISSSLYLKLFIL